MRKNLLLLALLPMLGLHAQQLEGSWKGTLNVGLQKLTMVLHIDKDKPSVTIDIPEQGGENIPMEVKHLSADSIHVTLSKNNASYEGKLNDGQLKGVFKQNILALPLNFEPGDVVVNRPQEPHPPYPYTTEEVRFVNLVANDTLAGTLTYPIGFKKKKAPVVLMVTGSGPQNRDEQVFRHKPFLVASPACATTTVARGHRRATSEMPPLPTSPMMPVRESNS